MATSWVITITLSASDATAHVVENPFWPEALRDERVLITLALLAVLGGIFLKGFREAIGIAVAVVGAYLLVNLVVVGGRLLRDRDAAPGFWPIGRAHSSGRMEALLGMIGVALLVFPRLALGLSGFETGVSMMPLVRGDADDDPERPEGRIRNTRKMLLAAALIMCFYLMTTSFVTTLLIPQSEFGPNGEAQGRALAYVAHEHLGNAFGTIYDISTITILWFAGASAMAGLLNVVPRYLPRYGMSPEWGRAVRPLVLVYTAISMIVTVIFAADVGSQAGAYATGILAMMTSAGFAVTLTAWRARAHAGHGPLRDSNRRLRLRAGLQRLRTSRRHHHRVVLYRGDHRYLPGIPRPALDRAQAGADRRGRDGQEFHRGGGPEG